MQEALDHYGYYTKQAGYPGAWTPGNVAAALRRLREWLEHMDDPSDFEEEEADAQGRRPHGSRALSQNGYVLCTSLGSRAQARGC